MKKFFLWFARRGPAVATYRLTVTCPAAQADHVVRLLLAELKGAGLAVNWVSDFRLNLRAAWARRIGNNPNPNINGSDQDGTLHKNRFWLQASLPF